MTAEEANAMDSSQDADDNIVCPDNADSPNTSKPDEDQIMDTVNAPQDESTINDEDAVPQFLFENLEILDGCPDVTFLCFLLKYCFDL